MTQNTLSDEINEIVESLCKYFDWETDSEQAHEIRQSLCTITEKTVEAVRVEKSNNIGNTINESDKTLTLDRKTIDEIKLNLSETIAELLKISKLLEQIEKTLPE